MSYRRFHSWIATHLALTGGFVLISSRPDDPEGRLVSGGAPLPGQRRLSGSTSTDQGGPGSPPRSATGSAPRRTRLKRQRPPLRGTYAGAGPAIETGEGMPAIRARRRSAIARP